MSTIIIDEVAFGRMQKEIGEQLSNLIMLQVQVERLGASLAEALTRNQALEDRARRAEAANETLKAELSPKHAALAARRKRRGSHGADAVQRG